MQAVECNRYEDIDGPMEQHYQEYINDFNKPSNRIQDKKAEGSTVKCWKIAMALFCILFFAAFGGVTAIFVLHYESQGMWNQGYLELDSKFQQLQQKYSNEYLDLKKNYERLEEKTALLEENSHNDRNQTAIALEALNDSARTNLHRLNADITDIKRRQDDESTYRDPVLVKLLGWQKSENVLFKYFPDAVNYGTAGARCSGYPRGRLATKVLRDPQAVRTINSMRLLDVNEHVTQPWVGYTDLVAEGSFIWADGGSTNHATTAWFSGQPDNAGGNEDCVEIGTSTAEKVLLNDLACSDQRHYMCEVDIYS